MKLWDFLKQYMLQYPMQTVSENNAKMTYEELVVFVEIFAKKLNGLRKCAILCGSEFSAAIALLGCFAAEITAIPLSQRYGDIHCKKIIDLVHPQAIITDEDGAFHINTYSDGEYMKEEIQPALIMCTSGTTGTPKGAMLSHKNIITNVSDIADYFDISSKDTILISRPIYHCAVLTGELLVGLIKGVDIRFYSGTFNPSVMLDLIHKYNITTFCGTPTLISMMSRLKRKKELKLNNICISGECLDKQTGIGILNAFPDSKIYHVYGLTEAGPRVCYLPPELFKQYPDYVGIPLSSVSVKIINADGEICKNGEEGVLWIKGNNVMLGYYENKEKTHQILHNGWLCTGDIAIKNDMGLIKIKGREDNLIIKAGMNIYPSEIESAINKDFRVKDVIVYGYDSRYGKQIGMKVVGDFNSTDEIKRLCAENLPSFQIPNLIELVNELPKNVTGKKIRRISDDRV